MKILIDGRWIGRTGLGRYTTELLRELQKIDNKNNYVVLLLAEQYEKWQPTNPRFTKAVTTTEVYTFDEQRKLASEISALKPDLVHFPFFNLPIAYSGNFVVTVHDLTLLKFKNIRGTGVARLLYEVKYNAMKLVLRSAVKRSTHIITATEYVKDAVVDRYDTDRNKITVTPLAVGEALDKAGSIERIGAKKPFILYVGNYYPYKNVRLLVDGFAKSKICADGGSMVCTGKPEHFQNIIRDHVKTLGIENQVIFPGFVSDEELAGLFQEAKLYVFPSLSEGFGLPGLEAMAHGTPVLSAYASCLPEVYEESAAYFDAKSATDLTKQLDKLLGDPDKLAELSRLGLEQVKKFSWKRTAQQTLEVYEAALRVK